MHIKLIFLSLVSHFSTCTMHKFQNQYSPLIETWELIARVNSPNINPRVWWKYDLVKIHTRALKFQQANCEQQHQKAKLSNWYVCKSIKAFCALAFAGNPSIHFVHSGRVRQSCAERENYLSICTFARVLALLTQFMWREKHPEWVGGRQFILSRAEGNLMARREISACREMKGRTQSIFFLVLIQLNNTHLQKFTHIYFTTSV